MNGHGERDTVKNARIAKTVFLYENPAAFLFLLEREIRNIIAKHDDPGFRLNAYSDIPWEWFLPADLFQSAVFYGYTKAPLHTYSSTAVSLTRSISENHSDQDILDLVAAGENVTVVLDVPRGVEMPATHLGVTLTDGDVTDDRSLDVPGTLTGLRGKGRLTDGRESGFIRQPVA
jgi:hypothetical protein